jgi:hypothetical protein
MRIIDLHNYEAFLLDYLDGNLNEDDCANLRAFVIAHPELEIDLEDTFLPKIADELMQADFKTQLKKTEANFCSEDLIHFLENTLSDSERKRIELRLLEDRELAVELALLKKTVLPIDEQIVFENKQQLIKTEVDFVLNNRAIAYVENLLSDSERNVFELEFVENIDLKKEIDLIVKTKLVAEPFLVYPNKKELKREHKVISLFGLRASASMAAAILLLLGLLLVFNYYLQKPNSTNTMAKQTIKSTKKFVSPENLLEDSHAIIEKQVSEKALSLATNKTSHLKKSQLKNDSLFKRMELAKDITNQIEEKKHSEAEVKQQEDVPETTLADNEKNRHQGVLEDVLKETTVAPIIFKANKQTVLLASANDDDDDENLVAAPSKKGFWKRAVKLAKQVNQLGIRSIDGSESSDKNYSLSFNSFSVEKR